MNELEEAVERLRLEMMLKHPRLAENLKALEAHILHERDATIGHIRHIRHLRQESQAMIRGELEALREVLAPVEALPEHAPPPLPTGSIPDIEQRFTKPRFLAGVH